MGETTSILIGGIDEEEKKEFKEKSENMASVMREFIKAFNKTDGEIQEKDDLAQVKVSILRTYRNAIEKNIQALESQKQKIEEEIDKFSPEDDDVLIEIEIDSKSL